MRGSFNLFESAGVRSPSRRVPSRKITEQTFEPMRIDRINRYVFSFARFSSPRVEGEPRSPFIKARGAYRIFLTAMKALSPGRAEVLRFTFN